MAKQSQSQTLQIWILGLLILLAFGRGIYALGGKSLWWDESLSLHRARGTLTSVLSNEIVITDNITSNITQDNHPPFYFLLLWVTVRLVGDSEFALRSLSLASVVLIVPLLFATGRRLIDERVGMVAAGLAALSPMYLWYGQEARMYALLTALSLISFHCFIRAFFDPVDSLDVRRRGRWMGAYILASLCLVFTHYLAALLIVFQLVALALLLLRQANNRRVLGLIMGAIGILVLPLALYAWRFWPRSGKQPGFRFVPLFDLLRDLLNSFSLGLSVDVANWCVIIIDLVFLLFLVLGFVHLMRRPAPQGQHPAAWLLAGYLLLPIGIIYAMSYVQPTYMNSRHMILITPAFYLLVAAGLTSLKGRLFGIALVGGLLMLGGISYSTWNYFTEPAYDKDDHRQWGAYLREHVRPGDVVVVEPPHIAELYQYYADSGAPWIGLPLLDRSRAETTAMLEDLRTQYDRIWVAFSHTPPWGDRRRFPERWLTENAFRADYKPIHSYASSVFIANYLPDWPSVTRTPTDMQPADVRYGSALRLTGFRQVSPAVPHQQLHVELFWAVDEPIPKEASVMLRLVDEKGRLWGQGEQCPFHGLYPMWQWQPGLVLRDEHELLIQPGTPPGVYQLELILVSRPTEEGCLGARGEPIPPTEAPIHVNRGDRVLLGTVKVERTATPVALDELGIERRHNARFGALELLGSSLAPAELKSGDRLAVGLAWQAWADSLPDMQFHLRLVDASGETRQEATIHPATNIYPTSRWQAGDRFRGQFWLRLPDDAPPGRYEVDLAPVAPLAQTGFWAKLRGKLGDWDGKVKLGNVNIAAQPKDETSTPATAIPTPQDLTVSQPMYATLGDQVRFLGYDLETETVRAGENLAFTLYWQALKPMDVSYTVFTHLLGPENVVLGQQDSLPRRGSYPTTLWRPGEVIVDPYDLAVSPDAQPGSYPVEIGMYRLETGVRLPITDASGQLVAHNRVLLPGVTVLPALAPTPIPAKSPMPYTYYVPIIMLSY